MRACPPRPSSPCPPELERAGPDAGAVNEAQIPISSHSRVSSVPIQHVGEDADVMHGGRGPRRHLADGDPPRRSSGRRSTGNALRRPEGGAARSASAGSPPLKPAVAAGAPPHRNPSKAGPRGRRISRAPCTSPGDMNSGTVYSRRGEVNGKPWPRRAPPSHLPEGLLVLRAMRTTLLCLVCLTALSCSKRAQQQPAPSEAQAPPAAPPRRRRPRCASRATCAAAPR